MPLGAYEVQKLLAYRRKSDWLSLKTNNVSKLLIFFFHFFACFIKCVVIYWFSAPFKANVCRMIWRKIVSERSPNASQFGSLIIFHSSPSNWDNTSIEKLEIFGFKNEFSRKEEKKYEKQHEIITWKNIFYVAARKSNVVYMIYW